jgi:tetratricopeptide (TPR) repeat protein
MTRPIKLFLSYAHEDEAACRELLKHLGGLRQDGLIETWTDHQIPAGAEWHPEIARKLDEADLILLLITAGFLNSNFCYTTEMVRAIERHDQHSAVVIPIITDACFWQAAPFAKLQGLPKGMKPIASRPKAKHSAVYAEVAAAIHQAVQTLAATKRAAPPPPAKRWLPAEPMRCFGREAEIEDVVQALLATPLRPVPVLGGAGWGKSTVTLKALHDPRINAHYGRRRAFVRCDSATTANAVYAEIAQVLGIPLGPHLSARVQAALTEAPIALAIDNAETPLHGEPAATEALLAELAALDGVALIVTIRGHERPVQVPWRRSVKIEPLDSATARAAFLAVAGDLFATDPRLPDLLKGLDGIPLAIELMGHVCQAEPNLNGIWRCWCARKTAVLDTGVPDRLHNAEVSFDLSLNSPRMTADGRRLFALLGVLPDGIAEQDLPVLLPDVADDAAAVLRRFALAYDEGGRVRTFAPLREFAHRRYPPAPEDLARAVNHYRELAELGDKVGQDGGGEAVTRLTPELANLEEMISHGLDSPDPRPFVDAAIALGKLNYFAGIGTTTLLDRTTATAGRIGWTLGEAACIFRLGEIALHRSDHKAAQARFNEALLHYRRIGNVRGEANCIASLGEIALHCADHEVARVRFEEALALNRQAGNVLGEANCIRRLGEAALNRFDHDTARARFEEALPLYRRVESVLGEANSIHSLGTIALQCRDDNAARTRFEEALPLYRRVGTAQGEANCLHGLGNIALNHLDPKSARALFEEALSLYRRVGDVMGEANCIINLGDIAAANPDLTAVRAALAQALALYQSIPNPQSIGMAHYRLARIAPTLAERQQQVAAARAAWLSIGWDDLVQKLDQEFAADSDPF